MAAGSVVVAVIVSTVLPAVAGAAGRVVDGGFGKDRITGTGAADQLSGGSGGDRISGRGGNDRLDGGSGNDRVFGGTGNDRIDGGDDDDRVQGDGGHDFIVEKGFGDDVRLDGGRATTTSMATVVTIGCWRAGRAMTSCAAATATT